jgi:hypothetical protein
VKLLDLQLFDLVVDGEGFLILLHKGFLMYAITLLNSF